MTLTTAKDVFYSSPAPAPDSNQSFVRTPVGKVLYQGEQITKILLTPSGYCMISTTEQTHVLGQINPVVQIEEE